MNPEIGTPQLKHATTPLLAWDVWVNDVHYIAFATTKPKARWQAVKSYWEAGYGRTGMWPSVQCSRAERYDVGDKKAKLIALQTIARQELCLDEGFKYVATFDPVSKY